MEAAQALATGDDAPDRGRLEDDPVQLAFADPAIEVSSPIASPDGHQIAFLSRNQVWLMNGDGTRPTALTREDPASFPYSCRAVAWTRT